MITIPTFILVKDLSSEKDIYINPTQIICIRPSRSAPEWKVIFCNEIHITVDESGLKTITDHSEVLIKKI